VLGVLVGAGMTPGDAQQTLFAIGAYVIGSATEWQAEAERASAQPLPDRADEKLNALRAEVLSGQPLLLQAIADRLERSDSSAFEFGLDLLIDGLRTRYAGRA
jgi:TetR/AcrR family tetracycline transcriptional repressor